MSRLRALHVPLAQGLDDRVEPGILPDGVMSRLENGRFNKLGELALRRGWRQVDMSRSDGAGALVVRDLYSYGSSLVGLTSLGQFAAYSNPTSTQPWYLDGSGTGVVSSVRDVRHVGGTPAERFAVVRASAAFTSDGVYGCTAFGASSKSGASPQMRVFRVATDETLFYQSNIAGASKVVNLGTKFGLVVNTGSALVLYFANPTNATPSFGSPVTLVTATITDFDACTAVVASPARLYVAWRDSGGAVTFGAFSVTTGAAIGSTKTVAASGRRNVQIASNDTIVHVVSQATVGFTLSLLSFNASSPFATVGGPTTVLSGQDYVDYRYSVGVSTAANDAYIVAQDADASTSTAADVDFAILTSNHGVEVDGARSGVMLSGGVVVLSSAVAFTGHRDNAVVLQEISSTYTKPLLVVHGEGQDIYNRTSETYPPYYPAATPDGTVLILGQNTENNPVLRIFRQALSERRQGVSFNGQLYVSGGVPTVWSGVTAADAGLLAPVFISATSANSTGTLTNSGAYKYRAILRWKDERGADMQGEVSAERSITLGASDDTVTLEVAVPPSRQRSTFMQATPTVELYRTEAGPGELFYFVSATATTTTVDSVTIIDTTPDSALIGNTRLYTEGENGATSGRFDNVLARSSTYAAATRDRLVFAGPEPEYQVSQLALASEPVGFTDPGVVGPGALVYFDTVDEAITGVASLDDDVIVGTRRNLFTFSASGGPNYAGVGEFPSPARLPSNVGFYDWRSILETDEGLWFLGDSDKLFLLARGQAAPAWEGEAVQDRLGDASVVGAGRDAVDQIAAWAVAASSTPRLVVRDLSMKLWSTDGLPFVPATLVTHQGGLWAADTSGTVWTSSTAATYGDGTSGATAVVLTFDTGDISAFGLDGWGRTAGVGLRGTFQAAAAVACSISYNSGLSYTSLGSYSVTGLTTGEAWQRQWYPASQRGGKFRLRFTMTPTVTTTEGCRITGYSIFYVPRPGPGRFDSSRRK